MPFDIPDNWTWIRLKNLFEIRNGFTPLRSKVKYWENGTINWFTVEDIHNQGRIISSTIVKINECACTRDRIVPANSLLLCCTASIGEYALTTIPLTTNQQFNALSLKEYSKTAFNIKYLLTIAPWFKSILLDLAGTTTFPFVSTKKLENILIPFPPLNEQLRISEKVSSFEPLIVQYSTVEEKLSILEEEFPKKLKKSILQYAIEGKLVKQDPNDEPASVLLERIKAEKEKLIKEGKIKRDKYESYIYQCDDKNYYEKVDEKLVLCEDIIGFSIPSNWSFCNIGNISSYGNTVLKRKIRINDWLLELEDIESSSSRLISKKVIKENTNLNSKVSFEKGMILYSKLRPYLDKVLIANECGVATSEIVPFWSFINPRYLILFLKSPYFISKVTNLMYGVKMPRLGTNDMNSTVIAIPPSQEQNRILVKLDLIIPLI